MLPGGPPAGQSSIAFEPSLSPPPTPREVVVTLIRVSQWMSVEAVHRTQSQGETCLPHQPPPQPIVPRECISISRASLGKSGSLCGSIHWRLRKLWRCGEKQLRTPGSGPGRMLSGVCANPAEEPGI